MKKQSLITFCALLLLTSIRAHAQSGCSDSPENPTLILAALALATFAATKYREQRGRQA